MVMTMMTTMTVTVLSISTMLLYLTLSLLVPSVSSAPSASSISLHNSVNPPKKKKTALTHISSSAMAPSGNIAIKITPAIALYGMRGTLNCLTDIMEQKISLGSSPSSPRQADSISLRTRAIMLLQTCNDNLSTSEKMKLIHKFTKDIELAKVYIALTVAQKNVPMFA
jgi:hypothetical protein